MASAPRAAAWAVAGGRGRARGTWRYFVVFDVLSEFVVLAPLGLVDEDTLPLADIEAEVEVSLEGVVDVLELLGDEVSLEAVVVGGVVATVVDVVVVEPGVALVPELL